MPHKWLCVAAHEQSPDREEEINSLLKEPSLNVGLLSLFCAINLKTDVRTAVETLA